MSMAIYARHSRSSRRNASPGPSPIAPASAPIAAPKDRPYPGEIRLAVDASDLERRIVRVHETLSGLGPDTVLLYPKWLPGTHAPQGPIDRLAGIRMTANGASVSLDARSRRCLRVSRTSGLGVKSIDIDFDYLSPTSSKVGPIEITRDILALEWNALVLYPAGYFTPQIRSRQASRCRSIEIRIGSGNHVPRAARRPDSSASPSRPSSTVRCTRAGIPRGLTSIPAARCRSI